jgi:hypothetical protein
VVGGSTPAGAQAIGLAQNWSDVPAVKTNRYRETAAQMADRPQLVLFDPAPMVPQAGVSQALVVQPAPELTASAAPAAAPSQPAKAPAQAAARPAGGSKPSQLTSESRPDAAVNHHTNRQGFVLDDAQIASIKTRLHLTPDQERMWPAVAAALRNVAYAKAHEAHPHGAPPSAIQATSVDPNSAEVEDLKSAAIPLIMSFNSEQKDEVRNLAHVMGLDQLATQF